MEQIAGWVAPAATMIAAMMTAANLGARVTGWGFVVFAVGSIGWIVVAVASGQQNLLWTNGFLTLVNVVGVWRWLGRQVGYEDGGQSAAEKSARAPAATLSSVAALSGRKVTGPDGQQIGVVVDAMMRCDDASLAYVVVSEGGLAGVHERLHALKPEELIFTADAITFPFDGKLLVAKPVLAQGEWPASLS